ncbi:MAG: UDP-N-acetylmuramate dehydrogenase [candidate division WOR-3 bacterium]|nr:MAG: UDP-N-acetylmuramate dehydrogenase [candidate division WOR-3 bacterium]
MKHPFERIRGIRVRECESLSKYTSLRVGGEARYFIYVDSKRALSRILEISRRDRIRYVPIGAGTNVLVADSGYDGAVLKLSGAFKRIRRKESLFRCGGGVLIERFLREATKAGYGGGEFLAGIPGTLGGAVKGNAGAFGHAVGELVVDVHLMDEHGLELVRTESEIVFTYRSTDIDHSSIITAVNLRLRKESRKVIRSKIERNLSIRRVRQPIGYSAGSFFKNPPGRAAGELIDICGLKGMSVGDAEVSRKHGNYIMNRGHARAADVLELAERIKKVVRERTGVALEEEVRLLS